jgi:hypothetical protein
MGYLVDARALAAALRPEQLGELFRTVQLKGIFPDSKTFADLHFDESPPRSKPD